MKSKRNGVIVSYNPANIPQDIKLFLECIDLIDELSERMNDNPTKEELVDYVKMKRARIEKGLDSVLKLPLTENKENVSSLNVLLDNLSHNKKILEFIENYFV